MRKSRRVVALLIALVMLSACVGQIGLPSLVAPPAPIEPEPARIGQQAGQACNSERMCMSGVCDFIKQDMGQCAPEACAPGSQAQDVAGVVTHYCDAQRNWMPAQAVGAVCQHDYQCAQLTCKDIPYCFPTFQVYCRDGVCTEESLPDACEQQGLKRIVRKDEYLEGEKCVETMSQRPLFTVCAPCGNGACDAAWETPCNCPEDCASSF